jgi:carbamoyltransferase
VNILGISGLDGAVAFKRAQWPTLQEREYRISQGHSAAAALISDGRIIAAAEQERFDRRKHSPAFPTQAIRYCLREGGISINDVDELVHGFDYEPYQNLFLDHQVASKLYRDVYSRQALLQIVRRELGDFPQDRVHRVKHHLAHAASAYFTSGWQSCLVVVADGMGEVAGLTVYRAEEGQLKQLRSISATDSIGILYSLITFHLGFDFNSDEYKIMGLAPYGNPRRYEDFFQRAVELRNDGSIYIPLLRLPDTFEGRENYSAAREYLHHHLMRARQPDDPITDDHRDAAASLQGVLDRAMLHICGHFSRQTGLRRLALSGGVALNCTTNGRLLQSGLFDEIYVQPAAGDDGTALGAALYRSAAHGEVFNTRLASPLLGPSYSAAEIDAAIQSMTDRISVERFENLSATCRRAASLIKAGHVIAWFRGRMEFGPRALGNRSILADPGNPNMREHINAAVKMREAFRPFAPAASVEQAHLWFDVPAGAEFPYMIFTVPVREEHRASLPAVTHVDGSARLQTVSRSDSPDFHKLLCAVGEVTGRQVVLNTSFNVKGQPIVNTPGEAIATFLQTGIDYLFLENTLLTRPPR